MIWETEEHQSKSSVQKFIEEPKQLEQKLLPYDILGNLAHVEMLKEQGYMEEKEAEEVKEELKYLHEKQPQIHGEDVHTYVEQEVTGKTEAGKKIHTGRSRNDQVVLDTHLYMKNACIEIALKTVELIKELENLVEKQNKLIPGYTHQQQAMPSSTGLWASSFIDALCDDLKMLEAVFEIIDQNPLGAAASYGTSLEIDQDRTTELLGFKEKQENPINSVGSRGKKELMLVQALNHLMLDIQKLSEDLINFSEDQQIFEIPEDYTTGSSIMPQKKNPDILEMARAKAEEVNSSEQAIRGVIGKLPSGYNKDSQATKKHLFEAIETVSNTLEIMSELIEELEVSDKFELKDEIFAAHTANQKVEEGTAFRDAYRRVKKEQEYEKDLKPKKPVFQEYKGLENSWKQKQKDFEKTKTRLLNL